MVKNCYFKNNGKLKPNCYIKSMNKFIIIIDYNIFLINQTLELVMSFRITLKLRIIGNKQCLI